MLSKYPPNMAMLNLPKFSLDKNIMESTKILVKIKWLI